MTRDEIERHLNVGSTRTVRVDISPTAEYPGFVRTVTIYKGNRVSVEFNAHGYDEGGPVFNYTYDTLDDAIRALEAYLGKPLGEWVNFSRGGDYPPAPSSDEAADGEKRLADAIAHGRVYLPAGDFEIKDDGYWSNLQR